MMRCPVETVQGASQQHSDPTLTLAIYDHAEVSEQTLSDVESVASEIFRRAGVQLVWLDGFVYAAERRKAEIPAPEDPATLVVKLQPKSEAARYGVRSDCDGLGFESGAIIFVPSFDARGRTTNATRLGYIVAHEIGHMVLGANAHSLVGIMRGTLIEEAWTQAEQGTLGFTKGQARQIRTWIAKRKAGAWGGED
jgi:hypothetical protein